MIEETFSRIVAYIKSLFFKNKVTIKEYEKELKSKTKSQIIDLMFIQAGKINKNDGIHSIDDRKQMRSLSKRHLIKALILLKLYENKKIRKQAEAI